jgi:hypothetical protein
MVLRSLNCLHCRIPLSEKLVMMTDNCLFHVMSSAWKNACNSTKRVHRRGYRKQIVLYASSNKM